MVISIYISKGSHHLEMGEHSPLARTASGGILASSWDLMNHQVHPKIIHSLFVILLTA